MPATLSATKVSSTPKVTRRIYLIAPLIIALVGAIVVTSLAYLPAGKIAPGVHVRSVDLGGQNQDSAKAAIDNIAHDYEKREIILRSARDNGRDYAWKFQSSALGLTVDVDATVAKVMAAARDNTMGRVTQMVGGSHEAHDVAPVARVDSAVLTGELKKIAHTVNHAPTNSKLSITDSGGFKVISGKPGAAVDLDSSAAAVTKLWGDMLAGAAPKSETSSTEADSDAKPQGNTDTLNSPGSISNQAPAVVATVNKVDLVFKVVAPPVSADDLSKIDGAIGEMNTRIRGTSQRVNNVTIATSHINGTLLAPGATFSYNQVVGKRSEEGGYEKAIIFLKGKHVEDIGGGICQTASTLYNAVLRAGLKVVRRQPHCTPVVYVPYGLDATVAYGVVDFQFRNDSEYPVYIYAKAKGRSLTFRLYGKTDPNRKVVIEKLKESSVPTSTQVVLDRSLRPGRRIVKDKGARGYTIVWRRTITENGKTVKSETINSHYRPLPAVVAVGPGVPTKAAPSGQPPVPVVAPGRAPGAVHDADSRGPAPGI